MSEQTVRNKTEETLKWCILMHDGKTKKQKKIPERMQLLPYYARIMLYNNDIGTTAAFTLADKTKETLSKPFTQRSSSGTESLV